VKNLKRAIQAGEKEVRHAQGDHLAHLQKRLEGQKLTFSRLEALRPEPMPIALSTIPLAQNTPPAPATPIMAKCAALRKATLERRLVASDEQWRKQFVKICYYALATTIGVLALASAAVAIAATAGAAVGPVLLALSLVLMALGSTLFGVDIGPRIAALTAAQTEKRIPTALAAAQLSHELFHLKENDRRKALEMVGVGSDADETAVLRHLSHWTRAEIDHMAHQLARQLGVEKEEQKRLLRAVGLDPKRSSTSTRKYLAELAVEMAQLNTREEQNALLRSMDIAPESVSKKSHDEKFTEAELLIAFTKQFESLFPETLADRIRKLLPLLGMKKVSSPEDLAHRVEERWKKERRQMIGLLGEMGVTMKDVTKKGGVLDTKKLESCLKKKAKFLFESTKAA
jgi:hypothetical protein